MNGQIQKPPIIVELCGGITITFWPIPAGRFRMGRRNDEAVEEPVTEVEVPGFWMGETPVTQKQYRLMAEACIEKLSVIEGNLGSNPSDFKDREDSESRPVENVNWYEARVVAEWLMEKMCSEGKLPETYVVDLPPEDYWEYACRAGTDTEYWSGDGDAALAQVGMVAHLDHFVRGQDRAKRDLAVAVNNQYKARALRERDGEDLDRHQLPMIGPTSVVEILSGEAARRFPRRAGGLHPRHVASGDRLQGQQRGKRAPRPTRLRRRRREEEGEGIVFLGEIDIFYRRETLEKWKADGGR